PSSFRLFEIRPDGTWMMHARLSTARPLRPRARCEAMRNRAQSKDDCCRLINNVSIWRHAHMVAIRSPDWRDRPSAVPKIRGTISTQFSRSQRRGGPGIYEAAIGGPSNPGYEERERAALTGRVRPPSLRAAPRAVARGQSRYPTRVMAGARRREDRDAT